VPLILDHSYLVGELTSSKIADSPDFRGSKAFVSAIFEFVKFPTKKSGPILGDLSNIR
jgi:hypothetical protein